MNKTLFDQDNISHGLQPLRNKRFEDFHLLSRHEDVLLLYADQIQQQKLRRHFPKRSKRSPH